MTRRVPTEPISEIVDLDAERSVLGGLLRRPDLLPMAAPYLKGGECFYLDPHKLIYQAIVSVAAAGEPVDNVTVAARLRETGMLERIGGSTEIVSLQGASPAPSNVESHAKKVGQLADRRAVQRVVETALGDLRDPTRDAGEVVAALAVNLPKQGNGLVAGVLPRQDVETIWANTITPKPIAYLWKRRLARGKLTVIGGDPAIGKGTLGVEFVKRLSRAQAWPDGGSAPLTKSLMLSPEDDPEDTLVPRLQAAGCDCSMVGFLGRVVDPISGQKRRITLETDAELLMKHAQDQGAGVVVIDPLASYLGGRVNSWRDSDMRQILDPLSEAAARYGIAVVAVVHLTKTGSGRAMYRLQGSIANVAAARFAFLVAEHPQEPELRVLAGIKANLSKMPSSLTFRIAPVYVESVKDEVGRVEWVGAVNMTADDLINVPVESGKAAERAEAFLREFCAAGTPLNSTEIKQAAKARGIGVNSLWDAKNALGMRAAKDGLGGWTWQLMDVPTVASERATSKGPLTPDACPSCGKVDYVPLGDGRRLCACFTEF